MQSCGHVYKDRQLAHALSVYCFKIQSFFAWGCLFPCFFCATAHSMCAPYDEALSNVLQQDLTRYINLNQPSDVKS